MTDEKWPGVRDVDVPSQEMGCRPAELNNAVRLLSLPSVLVNRHAAPRPQLVPEHVERTLLTKGFDQPTAVPFGIAGVSVGFATWSGLAYHAISPERALTADELVSLEIDVQMLWAYCRQVQRVVENRRDPVVPHGFGWRFLRAARSRLTTARVQETAQHCMMRQAAVTTSGLPEHLTQAQAALRSRNDGWKSRGMSGKRAALIVIDMQNGFINDRSRHVIPRVVDLVEQWEATGKPVVFTRYYNYPGSPFEG
ncbi:isochorismatase family protein [Micromonospora sp. BRA006-A]|nr:isochorismatase family protein [Micromonospora sp. BRA006-A]